MPSFHSNERNFKFFNLHHVWSEYIDHIISSFILFLGRVSIIFVINHWKAFRNKLEWNCLLPFWMPRIVRSPTQGSTCSNLNQVWKGLYDYYTWHFLTTQLQSWWGFELITYKIRNTNIIFFCSKSKGHWSYLRWSFRCS